MPIRSARSLWTILALGILAAPVLAQEPTHEAILSENPGGTSGFASVPGGGVYVTWSESVPAGARPRNLLLARRLGADLRTRRAITVADDRRGPQTNFLCPVVARVGANRLAFAWLEKTATHQRAAFQVTTTAGMPIGPVRYAENLPGRSAYCPSIGGFSGGFTLAWPSGLKEALKISFRARSFDPEGDPVSPQLEMQPETFALGFPPGLAVDERGHFTISWSVLSSEGAFPARIRMRRFLRKGIPTTGIVEVAGETQEFASLTPFGQGDDEGVEILWRYTGPRNPGAIRVRRFNRQLQPLGPARTVARSGYFGLPAVRVDAKGRSAIVWGLSEPQVLSLFLDDALAPCAPPFSVEHDRVAGAATLAFSGPDEVAIGLIEQGADNVRRLVVRTFSLSVCPAQAQ